MSSLEKLKNVAADKTILYIESDKTLQKNFGVYLQKIFKNFYQAYDGQEGFILFLKVKPEVIIMDLDLEKKDSIELIVDILELDPNIKILTVSSSNENYSLLQSIDMGLSGMLLKPINFAQLADKLISFLPPVKKVIPIQKENSIKKQIVKPIVKPISKQVQSKIEVKPVEKVQPKKEVKLVEKKVVRNQVQEQLSPKVEITNKSPIIEKEKKEINLQKKSPVEPKIEINIPKTCMEDIQKLHKNKESIMMINTYKGITIQNKGEFVNCNDNSFELQTTVAQIVAANYEKHVVLKVENKNKYIFTNIINIDLKNNKLQLVKPKYINYQRRDPGVLRLTADKSFKATMFFNKTHIDFKAKQLSSQYVLLTTDALELDIKPNMQLDLTFGFEMASPSVLIKEKKFTKIFAKGVVIRVDKTSSGLHIAMSIEVQKSGQSNFTKYLKQRENETIEELKKIIKR